MLVIKAGKKICTLSAALGLSGTDETAILGLYRFRYRPSYVHKSNQVKDVDQMVRLTGAA